MSDLRELYQDVILEHSKAPRNYRELPAANHKAEGYNPLCGDHFTIYLDEATSSLDSESEALIQQGLAYLMQGRTTFVIAHRLSTIRRADQILVVESGRIVERGNHQTLFNLGGRYFDLYTRQHGIEQNLFLAPGEGDTVEEADSVPSNGGSADPNPASLLR